MQRFSSVFASQTLLVAPATLLIGAAALLATACGGEANDPYEGTSTGATTGTTTGAATGTTTGTTTGAATGTTTGTVTGAATGTATGAVAGVDYPTAATDTLIELPVSEAATVPTLADFELVFHDDFDSFDTTIWETASHTFTENQATFAPDHVNVHDGYLVLRLDEISGEIWGGEARTKESFSYGRFETRARFAGTSGVVSSLFTYYDHWADSALDENWNELDVEFLGKDTDSIQFNVIHWNESDQRTTHEEHVALTYNPSEEFHDYAIEWVPGEVRFYVDSVLVHTDTEGASYVTLDQKMMMNIWPVIDSLSSWAGTFDTTTSQPVESYYDWARYYRYTGI